MNPVPVIYLVFNRPEATRQSFAIIRAARPPRLLVVADGPRPHVPDDAEKCRLVREIATAVDWPCRVDTDFSAANLGLKRRVSSGLDWAFGLVEEAIVVEDDCLLDPSFFPFAAELLEKYRHDERVTCISANNFQRGQRRGAASYYFSHYPHCWGWASWRRAWRHFDGDMAQWPRLRDTGWLRDVLGDGEAARHWRGVFDLCAEGKINSWATPWTFSCWARGGLTALPAVNLVRNIGFGEDGTNTLSSRHVASGLQAGALPFPLRHPEGVARDAAADAFTQREQYAPTPPPAPSGGDFPGPFGMLRTRMRSLLRRVKKRVQSVLEEGVTALRHEVRALSTDAERGDDGRILAAQVLVRQNRAMDRAMPLERTEFKVFSQFGDDGIIQYVVGRLGLSREERRFVEFGVESYREANTRFLLQNDNWSGLILDGSEEYMAAVRRSELCHRHDLAARAAFITRENIDGLLRADGFAGKIGLLSIGIDGNDYWVWEAITAADPALVIVEYNGLFGGREAVTVPYDPQFVRRMAHFSHLYYGASLRALCALAEKKGYAWIGCNQAGNNAYFVRKAAASLFLPGEYVAARFREGRDPEGGLTHVGQRAGRELMKELPVRDVVLGTTRRIGELDFGS